MADQIKMTGQRELNRKLAALPGKIQRRAQRKAVNAGGRVIQRTAKSLAPKRTGLLGRSLATKVKSYGGGRTVVAIIGQKKNKKFGKGAEVARRKKGRGGLSGRGDMVPIHLVDQPVKPHTIPGPVKIFGRTVSNVRHPGHRGAGFMSRAAKQSQGPAQTAYREKLAAEVEREAKTA